MDDDIHIAWGGGFDQPIFVGKEEAVRSTAAVEGSSVIHSGESESYQGEPSPRQEAPAARSRTRRASGSDEEAKKPSGPRRLRWHVSYGTPTARSASQRNALHDQSSDEYDGIVRSKRQRKEWRAVKQSVERADPVTTAKNKASRERQRREKLNDSFVDLSMALDPERSLKAEKTTVIADTIKTLGHIRSENGSLRHETEQLKEHIVMVESRNKELQFEHSLLKRELDSARQQNYKLQPHASFPGDGLEARHSGTQVVLGLPVHTSASTAFQPDHLSNAQGLYKGLERQSTSLPAHSISKVIHRDHRHPSLAHFQTPLGHGKDDSPISESQAILLGSPPDFFDIDIPMSDVLADLGKSSTELGFLPPTAWLPPNDAIAMSDSMTHV